MDDRLRDELREIRRLLLELVRLETMANQMVAESLDALKEKTADLVTAAIDVPAPAEPAAAEGQPLELQLTLARNDIKRLGWRMDAVFDRLDQLSKQVEQLQNRRLRLESY